MRMRESKIEAIMRNCSLISWGQEYKRKGPNWVRLNVHGGHNTIQLKHILSGNRAQLTKAKYWWSYLVFVLQHPSENFTRYNQNSRISLKIQRANYTISTCRGMGKVWRLIRVIDAVMATLNALVERDGRVGTRGKICTGNAKVANQMSTI